MNDTAQKNPTGTQYLEFASAIANATCHYLQDGEIGKDELQRLIGDKTLIKSIAEKNADEFLKLVRIPEEKQILVSFFKEVFNEEINLDKIVFPKKDDFTMCLFNPKTLTIDERLKLIEKKFGVNETYKYMSPVSQKIDLTKEQKRPTTPYAFCVRDSAEPDTKHLGKSYDDAIGEKMQFMNAEEYIIFQAYYKFVKKDWADKKGWTRTSSLWSDGYLVGGRWASDDTQLKLSDGFRGNRHTDNGPRELSL